MEIIVPDSVKRNEHRMLMKLSNYNHWDFLSAKTTEKCSGYLCSFHNALLLQGVVLSTSGEVPWCSASFAPALESFIEMSFATSRPSIFGDTFNSNPSPVKHMTRIKGFFIAKRHLLHWRPGNFHHPQLLYSSLQLWSVKAICR